MATTAASVADVCRAAKRASRALCAPCDSGVKDAALEAIADALERAHRRDPRGQRARHASRRARRTSATRCSTACASTRRASRAIAARGRARSPRCADPVGEVIEGRRLPNGLDVRKVRVPLGVVAVVYEARPNVTIDAAALCLKSGNAIVLRGSSHGGPLQRRRSRAIAAEAAVARGPARGRVSLVAGGGREELAELATPERDAST